MLNYRPFYLPCEYNTFFLVCLHPPAHQLGGSAHSASCRHKLKGNYTTWRIIYDRGRFWECLAYCSNRSSEDAMCTAQYRALSHLENKNTLIRILFVDYSSALHTIIPQKLQTEIIIPCMKPQTLRLDLWPPHLPTTVCQDWKYHLQPWRSWAFRDVPVAAKSKTTHLPHPMVWYLPYPTVTWPRSSPLGMISLMKLVESACKALSLLNLPLRISAHCLVTFLYWVFSNHSVSRVSRCCTYCQPM